MDFYHQICLSHTDFIYSVSVVQYLTSIIVVGRINIYLFIYLKKSRDTILLKDVILYSVQGSNQTIIHKLTLYFASWLTT